MVYCFWKVELDWNQNSTCLFYKQKSIWGPLYLIKETIFSERIRLVDSGLVVDIWWKRYKLTAHQMVLRKNEFRISTIWIKNKIVVATRKQQKMNEENSFWLVGVSLKNQNSFFVFLKTMLSEQHRNDNFVRNYKSMKLQVNFSSA